MCVISVSSLSPLPLSWLTICESPFPVLQPRILTVCSFITLLLTALFLWPLFRKTFRNSVIKRLAVRTLMYVRFALVSTVLTRPLSVRHSLPWLHPV